MKERLQARAEILGWVDANESVINIRLETFANETKGVIEYYTQQRLLTRSNGAGSKAKVQSLVAAAANEAFARASSHT